MISTQFQKVLNILSVKKSKYIILIIIVFHLIGCASIDISKLPDNERNIIDYTQQMIKRVSFAGDAALKSLFGKEKVDTYKDYTYFAARFGSKNGHMAVHKEFNRLCKQKKGKIYQTACIANNDELKVIYYYELFESYNKYTNSNTSMLLKLYIPKNIGSMVYLNKIRTLGYKIQIDIAKKNQDALEKQAARDKEIKQMSNVGTKVCKPKLSYISGWVEGAANGKIQIRLYLENKIIWDSPHNWRICG